MKKVIAALVVLILILLGAIILLLNHDLNAGEPDAKLLTFEQSKNYIECVLWKGDINDEAVLEGVVKGDSYLKTVEYEFKNTYELLAERDTIIDKDTSVLKVDSKEIAFDAPIRIVSLEEYEGEENRKYLLLTYLDFEALYIEAYYDSNLQDAVTHETVVTATASERDLHDLQIQSLGYEIVDNKIRIQLKASDLLLPGTTVKVHLIFRTYKDQWLAPNELIRKDNQGYYLTYLDEFSAEHDVYVTILYKGEEQSAIKIDPDFADRSFVYEFN